MRDPLEIQAMLIRHEGAMQLRGQVEPIDLLRMVVAPSKELAASSLQRAREVGVGSMAQKLANDLDVSPAPPRGKEKRVLTLDELLGIAA